jgi:hypothetical protein
MFVLQTKMTSKAERSSANQKPVAGMSSPGGEETGKGELNCSSGREPALTVILTSGLWILNSSVSRLLKAAKAWSRLLKVKLTIIFLFWSRQAAPYPSLRLCVNSCKSVPRLLKPSKAFSSLLKGIINNHFFFPVLNPLYPGIKGSLKRGEIAKRTQFYSKHAFLQ